VSRVPLLHHGERIPSFGGGAHREGPVLKSRAQRVRASRVLRVLHAQGRDVSVFDPLDPPGTLAPRRSPRRPIAVAVVAAPDGLKLARAALRDPRVHAIAAIAALKVLLDVSYAFIVPYSGYYALFGARFSSVKL